MMLHKELLAIFSLRQGNHIEERQQYYLKSSDENEKKAVQILGSLARDEEEVKV